MEENKTAIKSVSEEVDENIGRLNQSVEQLAETEDEDCGLEPEEVGSWVREIGRAIFAIIRP
jgi:hypothetical protein